MDTGRRGEMKGEREKETQRERQEGGREEENALFATY